MMHYRYLETLIKALNNSKGNIDKREQNLYNNLINDLLSFYTNMFNKQEKLQLLKLIYENKDNKEFICNIDNNIHYKQNKETLKTVSHLLEINL